MSQAPRKIEYLVGVDEVGRGPLAGPVSVGVFVISKKNLRKIDIANDSKKLTEKDRKNISDQFTAMRKNGLCDFVVISKTSKQIDKFGISTCIKKSIAEGLKKLNIDPKISMIKLDGLLSAPEEYIYQETITKGDSKEKVIGAASIVAKVHRDSHMTRIAKKYPEYGFEQHKGYGTKKHCDAIKKNGVCDIHRELYVRNVLR